MRSMESVLYAAAAVFQLAAMIFSLLMTRIRTKQRPWQILFLALLLMFVFRLIHVILTERGWPPVSGKITSAAALAISILIFASLFSIRKLALAERMAERTYRAVGESIDYGVWISDAAGNHTYTSPSLLKLIGLTSEEDRAFGWKQALHPDEVESTLATWRECVEKGQDWYCEHRFRSVDGNWHPVLSCGVPVRDAKGQITQWAGINLDIRRIKDSEERERTARMLAERQSRIKDEFLATLSHELRTPLNAIVGWTDLIRRSTDDRQTVVEGIDVIHRNAQAQTRLIDDLLDMSRIISGKVRLDIQQVYLAPLIDAAIESTDPAARAKGVRIRKVLDPLAGPVSGDPARLQQIVWNLLSNAIKFTPRGGAVDVLLERVNSHVEITVADNGEGIPPEFLPFLFERFRQADNLLTRKHFGLGLGLAISKNLVELHGGQIKAKSAGAGKGATFSVVLPVRVANLAEVDRSHPLNPDKSAVSEAPEAELRGIQVLVVDDDADARDLIARLLHARQANVSVASSAEEAHRLIALGQPDVIVSDIGMPGQDGYQFIRDLRKAGLRTPAIALTAFARSEDRMRALQAGYQMHLSKPVQPAELITVVGSVTGRLAPRLEEINQLSSDSASPAQ